jgi:hypothetical protein
MLVNNSDNHKNNCEFAEESVAYLYGDLDAAPSAEFGLHLKPCSSCAVDLKAFSSIQSSIQNWKAAKFDVLSTPVIQLPTDLRQKSGAEAAVSDSWLTNLRERFSFSFNWVKAGAFAALLVGLAFGLYFIATSGKEELASDKNNQLIITEVSPNSNNEVAKIEELDSGSQKVSDSGKSKITKSDDSLTNVKVDEKIPVTKKSTPSKVSINRKNPESKELPKQPLNRKNSAPEVYANAAPVNNRNLPKLNNLPEEAEEEDLRLADLFDEIDEG